VDIVKLTAFLILLFSAGLGLPGVVSAQEQAALTGNETAEDEAAVQLKVNKDALLQGPNEQRRIDAAIVLLLSKEKSARHILLEGLSSKSNPAVRAAVCKALSQSRSWQKSIPSREDFFQPLSDMLAGSEVDQARLAAEAMLIFEYRQVWPQLKKMISDTKLGSVRLNAVYALRLRPEKKAIFELIDLIDNPDKELAVASEKALQDSLGIPTGTDERVWRQITKELQQKSRDAFVRDRLVLQERKVRELADECALWRRLYLAALDRIYEGISDDAQRGAFLVEHLGSSPAVVRAWAVEKVSQWRAGTRPLPVELGPVLVKLISDEDKDIRLKTARLLSRMGDLNPAEQLLSRLKVETEEDVKVELLGALGEACYAAALGGSDVKVSESIRQEALELAGEYLADTDVKKAQKGGEVVKRLLEQNGLSDNDIEKYLRLLVQRYDREKDNKEEEEILRGELLDMLAGLCGKGVSCRTQASRLLEPVFVEALGCETILVREAAVTGLINIDSTRALKILTDKKRGLIDDESTIIRGALIELAGDVGSVNDLDWLSKKAAGSGVGESAWQAMVKIFRRCKAEVVDEWVGTLAGTSTVNDERLRTLLELAEKKAEGENKAAMARTVRMRLAELYGKAGQFDLAAKYYGILFENADNSEDKDAILSALLKIYLQAGKMTAAKDVITNRLLNRDLDANDVVAVQIERYLEASSDADAKAFVDLLGGIDAEGDRTAWRRQLERWRGLFGKVQQDKEPNDAKVNDGEGK